MTDEELLDMLDSEDKMESIPETISQSKPEYKSYGNKKDSKKKDNYWDKTDIEPIAPDTNKFKSMKSFTVYGVYEGKEVIPDTIIEKMVKLSTALVSKGYLFRHFGSNTNNLQTKILEIDNIISESFLPFPKWNEKIINPICKFPTKQAYHIAMHYNSWFLDLKPTVRAIIAAKINALLGKECDTPVSLVILYDPKGTEKLNKETDYKALGDLPKIIKICKECDIPYYNIGNEESLSKLVEHIKALN